MYDESRYYGASLNSAKRRESEDTGGFCDIFACEESGGKQPLVLLGHAIKGDLKDLKDLGVDLGHRDSLRCSNSTSTVLY